MPNIRLNYRYRDYANYKKYGSAVFANPNHLSLSGIDTIIRKHLINDFQFRHNEWGLPDLHFEKTYWEDDHSYHEFVSVEEVNEETDQTETIDTFLVKVEQVPRALL